MFSSQETAQTISVENYAQAEPTPAPPPPAVALGLGKPKTNEGSPKKLLLPEI